mgnify:FL=1|jgi:hypothetical protein
MTKIKLCIVSFGIIWIFSISCERERIETDPAKAILGKWEAIEKGNWPNLEPIIYPGGYQEYLPDSLLREYNYETGRYYYKKYKIDTLLYEYIPRGDGFYLTLQYKYQFFDNNNKLRLDFKDIAAIYNTFIFKRIN